LELTFSFLPDYCRSRFGAIYIISNHRGPAFGIYCRTYQNYRPYQFLHHFALTFQSFPWYLRISSLVKSLLFIISRQDMVPFSLVQMSLYINLTILCIISSRYRKLSSSMLHISLSQANSLRIWVMVPQKLMFLVIIMYIHTCIPINKYTYLCGFV
jgi:hypothetical protein